MFTVMNFADRQAFSNYAAETQPRIGRSSRLFSGALARVFQTGKTAERNGPAEAVSRERSEQQRKTFHAEGTVALRAAERRS